DIREAEARPDMSDRSLGGWLVALEFTPEGGDLFEEATGRMVKRRFAIVLDGMVESAPVVQTRIGGGRGGITMGGRALDEQATNAKKLEAVLRAGALPAPLLLLAEDGIEPVLSLGAYRALVGLAGLLLIAVMAYGVLSAFRRNRAATRIE